MMKLYLYMLFLIFFSLKPNFWLFQFSLFLLSFIFMFIGSYSNEWKNLSMYCGCDDLSFGLILLTFWICSLMMMSSYFIYNNNMFKEYYIFLMSILIMFLILTFSLNNLLMFYFFFECSLIPILCLILGWGNQLDRLQAGLYLLFYTLMASLPMLLMIIYMFNELKSLNFMNLIEYLNLNYSLYVYLFMIFAFLVKMPMFLVHLWLPKAHVEAPIFGSMILAGVMLKLGGYGLLRVLINFINLGVKYNYLFISLSLFGGVVISLICLFQVDLKSLIAYSSVAHMSLMLSGMLTLLNWGMCGSYLMMISHGLCSSGLFCLINIIYERLGSRSMFINKGLMNFMPSMCLWWFLLCSSNMSAPPSLNLLSEIILINSLISWSNLTFIMLIFLSFFSASYTLYFYSFSQHGKFNFLVYSFSQGYIREFMLLILHWIPLNLFIINSEIFLFWI
uniref:NADH dehydrogenase subunit 4 n=1 Tax=Augomonoctenus smithi TaxID=1519147 RepID=UPI0023F57A9D|nr:NADH dehydrogenase subunit 4 [Augomonoctenus smithi]WDY84675.1 NADH dehydrogenase subunit 4 [Augomonoctenus smithi]